jgi:hypothetical protein
MIILRVLEKVTEYLDLPFNLDRFLQLQVEGNFFELCGALEVIYFLNLLRI